MNDLDDDSDSPQFPDNRDPGAEWNTVLRLSSTLFVASVSLSLLAAWLFEIPLLEHPPHLPNDLLTGLAVSAPLLAGLFLLLWSDGSLAKQLWDVPVDLLGPALSRSSRSGLASIALMAGVGEELLFRGLLHNWLEPLSLTLALILPNVIFGLLHYVNAVYAVTAGVTGLYFSILIQFVPGVSLFSLMVAHAFYDYVALNCLTGRVRSR